MTEEGHHQEIVTEVVVVIAHHEDMFLTHHEEMIDIVITKDADHHRPTTDGDEGLTRVQEAQVHEDELDRQDGSV